MIEPEFLAQLEARTKKLLRRAESTTLFTLRLVFQGFIIAFAFMLFACLFETVSFWLAH
jgi:hypothetical protein